MKAKQLIKVIDNNPCAFGDFRVRGISCNSRKVSPGFIFVAIKGTREDGTKFIPEAIKRGAKLIVTSNLKSPAWPAGRQSIKSKGVCFIAVKDGRLALAKLAAAFYGNPSRKIKVVGITGTNGKTTVSYLIESILKTAGISVGVIGTVNYRFQHKIIPSRNTTPGPIELEAMLAQMLRAGIKYVAMEVSSHALDQDRTGEIDFHSAIFTNLTQDHLDYHISLKNYFAAKAKLFKNLKDYDLAVINNDDACARKLKKLTAARIITYGIEHKSTVAARKIKLDACGAEFILSIPGRRVKIKTKLIGRHNVYNLLAAIAWGLGAGISLPIIKAAVEKFRLVPGRLQRISSKSGFLVFVDYAHTDDALKNVITSLRQLTKGKIIVVFGCGGDRDKTKRPKMGRVVSRLADFAVITNDNPRSEEPRGIIEEIKKGIDKNNYTVVSDRREAIKKALTMARPLDTVLIAGKGHEHYQILKDRTVPFADCEVVRACLRSLNY